ncbi:transglycosylase domain-containing protein [Streptomyces sp. G-G2]|uniref:transglycosylase domain-containing protein n=1 Tax=Streptomyces sp. G-G2 TaxID=3046201 RepID=UPI0024B8AEFB|nr:transglycosylase domain-containing protein [Streptomyces sp. G-G2]MDJ0382450.1 transglycosylase domain-containing protein [Streptomyces sp. G-G2]
MRLPRKRRADRTGGTDDTGSPEQTAGPDRPRRTTGRAKGHRRAGRKGRRRRIDFPRRGRRGWRRWTPSWKLTSGLLLVFAGALSGLFTAVYVSVEIPNPHDSARRQATVYYWADGSRMVSVGDVNRQDVKLSDVPDSVQRGVIAAENADFYSDSGVSVKGIGRAAVNIVKGQETQGGSTITQQYVKNSYLSQDQTILRKVKELFLSLKVSNQRPKTEILEGYLNTSWFGRDAYGVQAASHAYYGIPAKELNPSQGALLAAVLKGAESFDPSLSAGNRQRAEDRWSWILDRQVDTGSMSAGERAQYTKFPEPKPPLKPTSQAGQIGYLVDITNKYLKSRSGITDKDLAGGGYSVHTTFEKDKVLALTKAVEQVRADRLDPKKRAEDEYVQVGAASIRPKDGAIVAVYGGSDAIEHFTNNADTSGVPAASAFKPFVYAAALEQEREGRERPAEGADPDPLTPRPSAAPAAPSAAARDLHSALVASGHTPFVEIGKKIGLKKVKELAVASGLREESMAKLEPTFSIGTSTPSAVRLANAYTTFVNEGRATEPYSATKVERNGVAVDGFGQPKPRRAMSSETASTVGGALRQVSWSAVEPPKGQRTYVPSWAGKTGPNDRMNSAWFIGATPELSTSVAMFRTKPGVPQLLPMQGVGGPDSERGSAFPPLIWKAYSEVAVPAPPYPADAPQDRP